MILGRVVGEVWATRRHAGLDAHKLLVVRPYFWYAPPAETSHLVAVDTVGANVGQEVLVCLGEGARRTAGSGNLPFEAAIAGVVDRVEIAADVGLRPLTFVDGIAPEGVVP